MTGKTGNPGSRHNGSPSLVMYSVSQKNTSMFILL